MGSPSNADFVTGDARIRLKEISTKDWCEIIQTALIRIKPLLKYVSGFKPIDELLNGELLTGYGKFVTADDVMPSFKGTGLDQKTRFTALQRLGTVTKFGHEVNWNVLLLTDDGNFVILGLSFFVRDHQNIVCGSSLTTNSTAKGHKSVLDVDTPEIRDRIDNGAISPYGVLDHLYLLFHRTVDKQEERLGPTRQMRDMLQAMCGKVSLE